LDGGVAQQELNLLEVPTGCAVELGAGVGEVVVEEVFLSGD
jgi:hypothetical protein